MIHNGLRGYPRLLEGMRRAIGEALGQDFTGVERFSETLNPTIDLWSRPEWAILRGERLFSIRQNSAAVAARFSSIELINAVGSGILAIVTLIRVQSGNVEVGLDTGAALGVTSTLNGLPVDSRIRNDVGPQLSVCTVVTGDLAAAITTENDVINAAGGTTSTSAIPYILRPGAKLFLIHNTANTAISATLFWSERPLLPREDVQ